MLGREGTGETGQGPLEGNQSCSQPQEDAPGAHQAVECVEFCVPTLPVICKAETNICTKVRLVVAGNEDLSLPTPTPH